MPAAASWTTLLRPRPRLLEFLAAHPQLELQLVGVGEQVGGPLAEGLAVLGQLHAPRGPLQQARAELRFELLHGGRHAGLGQAQLLGGLREAAELGDAQENAGRLQKVHDPASVRNWRTV